MSFAKVLDGGSTWAARVLATVPIVAAVGLALSAATHVAAITVDRRGAPARATLAALPAELCIAYPRPFLPT